MRLEIKTKHDFDISLYVLEHEAKAVFEACTNCLAKNSHVKLDNGVVIYFYCNMHDLNNPIYSVAILSKGRRVYYGEYFYNHIIVELNHILSEYRKFRTTRYSGR